MNVESTVGIISVLGTLLAVVVTVLTAITAARSSAFTQMKEVVERLDKDVKEAKETIKEQNETIAALRVDIERYRRLARMYEEYIRALLKQLDTAKIQPADISEYVKIEEEEHASVPHTKE